MHFQIFVPESEDAPMGSQAARALPTVGLADLVAGADCLPTPEGPDGRRGTTFAWRDPSKGAAGMQMGYRPDEQTAHPAIRRDDQPFERYTVLLWKDRPPRPAELARRSPPFGPEFPLGDGHSWHVPGPFDLPADILHNRAGEPIYALQPEFHAFTRIADDLLARIERDEHHSIGDGEIVLCLLEGLRLNYRIVLEVADALRLFSTANVGDPLRHAIAADRAESLAARLGGA